MPASTRLAWIEDDPAHEGATPKSSKPRALACGIQCAAVWATPCASLLGYSSPSSPQAWPRRVRSTRRSAWTTTSSRKWRCAAGLPPRPAPRVLPASTIRAIRAIPRAAGRVARAFAYAQSDRCGAAAWRRRSARSDRSASMIRATHASVPREGSTAPAFVSESRARRPQRRTVPPARGSIASRALACRSAGAPRA
jgi:hypothetical protein